VDTLISEVFWVGLLAATVRLSTPILLASLGEILAERAGVLNIGIEGMMLVGALGGFLGSRGTANSLIGVAAGVLAGMVLAWLFAYLTVTLAVDQVVCGITVNLLALGVTSFVHRVIYGIRTLIPSATPLPEWHIPGLAQAPLLGPILFRHNLLVYGAIVLVAATWFLLYRTTWGLQVRAVGEYPRAADSVGVDVFRVRHLSLLACGGLAGMGGAFLSLGHLNMFVDHMTAGRGFIALAVVIFGKWHPVGALGASLLFGAAEALQLRLQALGFQIPFQFLVMLPYVLTVVALAGVVGRSIQPAALTLPYLKESH
jgi:simple sugar transport system permease protein